MERWPAIPPFPLLLKFLDAHELSRCKFILRMRTRTCCHRRTGKTKPGRAGAAKEPHLCRPEARHYGSRSAAGAGERSSGDRSRASLEAGDAVSCGWDGSLFGRRHRGLEVQQNSDVTFRLYDWACGRQTGQPARSRSSKRCLHSLWKCAAVSCLPRLRRPRPWNASGSFTVSTSGCRAAGDLRLPSARGVPTVLVCIEARPLDHGGALMPPQKATCCCCRRLSEPVCPAARHSKVLEIGIRHEKTDCVRPGRHPCRKQASLDATCRVCCMTFLASSSSRDLGAGWRSLRNRCFPIFRKTKAWRTCRSFLPVERSFSATRDWKKLYSEDFTRTKRRRCGRAHEGVAERALSPKRCGRVIEDGKPDHVLRIGQQRP